MIRNLKVLGLLVVAALAMSAMVASAAQAQKHVFTTGLTENELGEVEHTAATVHAVQVGTQAENYFEVGGNGVKVSCKNETTTYKVAETAGNEPAGVAKTVTVTPEYKNCGTLNGSGELANELVTVNMNGCDYDFNQPETVAGEITGTADVVCPGTAKISVSVYANAAHTIKVCEETIGAQTGLKHVVYSTMDNGVQLDDVTANVTIEGIAVTKVSSTCPGGSGAAEGVYKANTTVTSTDGHDVWLSEE